ncbi:MAG TPA: 50S ribosomal protein L24 [Candidatus Paceibacterota bacterium]
MKIKKGDNVIVTAGKEKGKTGKVLRAIPADSKVIVEGLNIRKKHQKSRQQGGKGVTVEFSVPMHVSNVMLVEGGKAVRVGSKVVGDKKVRVSKKTGKTI